MTQNVVASRYPIDDEAGALESRDDEFCAKCRKLAAHAESLTVTGSRIGCGESLGGIGSPCAASYGAAATTSW